MELINKPVANRLIRNFHTELIKSYFKGNEPNKKLPILFFMTLTKLSYLYQFHTPLKMKSFSIKAPYTIIVTVLFILNLGSSCNSDDDTKLNPIPQAENWWNDEVFYEVFVRSFYDSDGNGRGDFQGLIQKLDYLNDGDPNTTTDLGVTALWLMPIFPSPSYHGYDVTDYRNVNSQYGTIEDFKLFLAEAHQRGIKVIIDFVVNHTSEQHPWFLESDDGEGSPKRDWYIWSATNPGYTGPWGQTVWHSKNSAYYYGVFWSGMPDLNFKNEEVTNEIEDLTKFWFSEIGVDGFRIDAAKHLIEEGTAQENTPATLAWWRDYYAFQKNLDPGLMTVGEVWTSTANVVPYTDERFDYCFEFDLSYAIIDAANNGNLSGLKSKIQEVVDSYPALQYGTFLTNHDQNRVIEALGGDVNKSKIAASILLTLPGIPYLYYGEEVGMKGVKPDENIRRPMQWTDGANAGFTTGTPWRGINSNYTTFNVSTMQSDPNSLWNHYRTLIHARVSSESLRLGNYQELNSSSGSVMAYLRNSDNESTLILHNVTSESQLNTEISVAGSKIQPGTYALTEILTGNAAGELVVNSSGGFNFTPLETLDAYTSYILLLN